MQDDTILEFRNITKTFPGVTALDDVSFKIKRGTVHALIGENGAGKSTLMKILDGLYHADKGCVLLDGEEIHIKDSLEAKKFGIGMIHQELNIVGELSIAQNIFLGKEPLTKLGLVKHSRLNSDTEDFLKQQNLNYNPRTKMKSMSVGEQQMIEIIKTVFFNSKIIIMDEPTSSLSEVEVDKLFAKIKELKAAGSTIIYISHRLEELSQIGDYLTIMRDGKVIETRAVGDITRDEIISLMVGRSIDNAYPKTEAPIGETVIEVKNLSGEKFKNINLNVKSGEIVGLSGLVGAGRTEVVRAMFGLDKITGGEITLNGKKIDIKGPRTAIDSGIMMVSEDRRKYGLITKRSVLENISLPNYGLYSKTIFVNHKKERAKSREISEKLRIKTPSLDTLAASLSGGNQQKIVIGKWLVSNPKVFILDEPTRGIDVGAKYEIYKLMCEFAADGMAIIMISSDMPELIGMADRIYVMSEGEISGELERSEVTQEKIMRLATNNIKRD
ncbi:MAG: sugar ABC transporter ATP-binding protein [Oscillospiraceae bacterium]